LAKPQAANAQEDRNGRTVCAHADICKRTHRLNSTFSRMSHFRPPGSPLILGRRAPGPVTPLEHRERHCHCRPPTLQRTRAPLPPPYLPACALLPSKAQLPSTRACGMSRCAASTLQYNPRTSLSIPHAKTCPLGPWRACRPRTICHTPAPLIAPRPPRRCT
jgi:hypothetical protein